MATIVVACGTCTGAAADALPVRDRPKGNNSGRSRCRCSVKDEVALAATWLAVDSCTHHSLNVVLTTSVQIPAFRGFSHPAVRVTGRLFGRMPGRTLRRWIRGRRRSRRAGHPRLRSMPRPAPPVLPGVLRGCLRRPGCHVTAAAAAPGLPLVFLFLPSVDPADPPICPSCHGTGVPALFTPQAECCCVPAVHPGTVPLPGSAQTTLQSGLWFPSVAHGWAPAEASRSRARRRSPSPSW